MTGPRCPRCGRHHEAVEADHASARETARRLASMAARPELANLAKAYLSQAADMERVALDATRLEARDERRTVLLGRALEQVDACLAVLPTQERDVA